MIFSSLVKKISYFSRRFIRIYTILPNHIPADTSAIKSETSDNHLNITVQSNSEIFILSFSQLNTFTFFLTLCVPEVSFWLFLDCVPDIIYWTRRKLRNCILMLCAPCFILQCVMTNEMHNSVIINFIPQFLSVLHVSNEFRTVVYSTLFCASNDERLDSFETCRADKNCGIKLIIT